ncbi:MAG TPA: NAD(P)/FAD-dependent oxidoreductase [Candidatus Sulfotelmatobacter sp.]|nr:NAD(P)/FAD-dependent oxidoreductase [Candidatus Sulfotelmatobacter sp.]
MPENVVILGAGFAGMNVARHLEHDGRRGELAVTIVNRENYMLFTPMLPEVASGSIEPRHITPPLRAILRTTAFELGDLKGVDLDARTVAVTKRREGGEATLPFDHLVVALGAESSTHGVPGAEEHSFPLKTVHDAVVVRDVTITSLENAAIAMDEDERRSRTTFVVVGGGFTGVEAAGELLAFLRSASRFYPHVERTDIRVVLVAGSDRLLEQLSPALGQRAATMLASRGVEVVFSDQVASVDAGGLTLASGRRFATRCVIWSAGERPSPALERIALKRSEHGAIEVRPDLSAIGAPGVWALGDCAHIPKPGGGAYPQTAQHAVHEARRLARNLVAKVRGEATRPYAYRARGMMASIGAHEGLAEIGGRVKLFGLPAWLLWRTYYLGQLPGNDRKARVMLDWTLDFPFPQDIASVR